MNQKLRAPELAPHEGSWVATSPDGHCPEFFSRANADKAARHGWKVETIGTYLGRINRAIKEGMPLT